MAIKKITAPINLFTVTIKNLLPDTSLYETHFKDEFRGTINAGPIHVVTRQNVTNQSVLTGHWNTNDFEIIQKNKLLLGNYGDTEINLTKQKAPFWRRTKIYKGNIGNKSARLEVTESFNQTILRGEIGKKPFLINIKTSYYKTFVKGLISKEKVNLIIDNKGKVFANETIDGVIMGKRAFLPIILTFAHKNINRVARIKTI